MTKIANESVVRGAVESVAQLDAEIARLTSLRKAHVETILNNTQGTGMVTVAGHRLTVSANNTYDQGVMKANLKPGQQARVMKKVVDNAKVKALYPEAYEAAKKENGRKVSVK